MPLYELAYHLSDCGDGSATASFHPTTEEARDAAGKEEGFGEPCYGQVDLKIEGGRLFFRDGSDWQELKPLPSAATAPGMPVVPPNATDEELIQAAQALMDRERERLVAAGQRSPDAIRMAMSPQVARALLDDEPGAK